VVFLTVSDGVAPTSTVLISVRQPLLSDALRSRLENRGFVVTATAGNPAEAVRLAVEQHPDVLLLDCSDVRHDFLTTLHELEGRAPGVRVLLYAGGGAIPPLPEAILAGARGVIFDDVSAELLCRAVRSVVGGEYWVSRDSVVDVLRHARQIGGGRVVGGTERAGHAATPAETLTGREFQVIRGIASGESNREMAERLGLSEATVKYYVTSVFDKLGASNRAELAALAVTRGLTTSGPPAGADGPAA